VLAPRVLDHRRAVGEPCIGSGAALHLENQGADAFLLDLAARIPSGSIVFSDTGTLFFDPFYPGLGHRIVRVDLRKATVFIDLGSADGLLKNARFEVFDMAAKRRASRRALLADTAYSSNSS